MGVERKKYLSTVSGIAFNTGKILLNKRKLVVDFLRAVE